MCATSARASEPGPPQGLKIVKVLQAGGTAAAFVQHLQAPRSLQGPSLEVLS